MEIDIYGSTGMASVILVFCVMTYLFTLLITCIVILPH